MAPSAAATLDRVRESAAAHHNRLALGDAKHHLQKSALKFLGYLLAAYLVLRLIPTLEKALHSLEHLSWEWLVGLIAIEVLSEAGFVIAWRDVVDPERVLEREAGGVCSAHPVSVVRPAPAGKPEQQDNRDDDDHDPEPAGRALRRQVARPG